MRYKDKDLLLTMQGMDEEEGRTIQPLDFYERFLEGKRPRGGSFSEEQMYAILEGFSEQRPRLRPRKQGKRSKPRDESTTLDTLVSTPVVKERSSDNSMSDTDQVSDDNNGSKSTEDNPANDFVSTADLVSRLRVHDESVGAETRAKETYYTCISRSSKALGVRAVSRGLYKSTDAAAIVEYFRERRNGTGIGEHSTSLERAIEEDPVGNTRVEKAEQTAGDGSEAEAYHSPDADVSLGSTSADADPIEELEGQEDLLDQQVADPDLGDTSDAVETGDSDLFVSALDDLEEELAAVLPVAEQRFRRRPTTYQRSTSKLKRRSPSHPIVSDLYLRQILAQSSYTHEEVLDLFRTWDDDQELDEKDRAFYERAFQDAVKNTPGISHPANGSYDRVFVLDVFKTYRTQRGAPSGASKRTSALKGSEGALSLVLSGALTATEFPDLGMFVVESLYRDAEHYSNLLQGVYPNMVEFLARFSEHQAAFISPLHLDYDPDTGYTLAVPTTDLKVKSLIALLVPENDPRFKEAKNRITAVPSE